eukprot:IDg7594t1
MHVDDACDLPVLNEAQQTKTQHALILKNAVKTSVASVNRQLIVCQQHSQDIKCVFQSALNATTNYREYHEHFQKECESLHTPVQARERIRPPFGLLSQH